MLSETRKKTPREHVSHTAPERQGHECRQPKVSHKIFSPSIPVENRVRK